MGFLHEHIAVFWLIFAGVIFSLIVGSRKLFRNWLAGIVLRAKDIQPGDFIEFRNGCAWVTSLGAATLVLQTWDKCQHIVPYHDFLGGFFPSKSYSKRDIIVRFPLSRDDASVGFRDALPVNCIATELNSVLAQRPALGIVENTTPQGVILKIRAWIKDPTDGLNNVRSQLMHEVLNRLNAAGISLPIPIGRDWSLN